MTGAIYPGLEILSEAVHLGLSQAQQGSTLARFSKVSSRLWPKISETSPNVNFDWFRHV
jgi:hypothetical protein